MSSNEKHDVFTATCSTEASVSYSIQLDMERVHQKKSKETPKSKSDSVLFVKNDEGGKSPSDTAFFKRECDAVTTSQGNATTSQEEAKNITIPDSNEESAIEVTIINKNLMQTPSKLTTTTVRTSKISDDSIAEESSPKVPEAEVKPGGKVLVARASQYSPKDGSSSACSVRRSDQLLPQNDSTSSVGPGLCRICMSCGRERLISPCYCKGSLGCVHVSCLERWLSSAGRTSCELCGFNYPITLTQRYSFYRALNVWFSYSRTRTAFQTDCLFFWVLSVVTTGLVACCVLSSRYLVVQGGRVGVSRSLTEALMDLLLATVLCGYAVTAYLLWRDHLAVWRRWRGATVDVRLVLENLNRRT